MSTRSSLLLALGILLPGITGCAERGAPQAERGRQEIARLQCGACHVIPGVRAARGSVGPTLEGFARRVHLAGKWPNQPQYLEPWLLDPPAMAPLTAMPAVLNDARSARDIAAYLYTLK